MPSSPASVLLDLSRLAAVRGDASGFLQRAGELLFRELELQNVSITAMDPDTKEVIQFHSERAGDPIRPSEGYVLIAEDLTARKRRIGRIEIHSARGVLSGSAMVRIAEGAAQQISSFFDTLSRRDAAVCH